MKPMLDQFYHNHQIISKILNCHFLDGSDSLKAALEKIDSEFRL